MNDLPKMRNEIKAIAGKAIDADNQEQCEEAAKLYIQAAEKLKQLIQIDENPNSKEVYKKRAMEYCNRAQVLRGQNPSKQDLKSSSTSPGSSMSDKPAEKKEEKKEEKGNGQGKEDPEADKLLESLSSCVVSEKPNVMWDDVAGLDKAKEALHEAVILPIRFPQLFTGKRKPWKGILLYGPPGTGKSFLAKACATETQGTFLSVSASNIVNKYMGESEKMVRGLFDLARLKRPCVIFLDEIDSLLSARSDGENESTRRIKTEFLVQMQGVGNDMEGVLVLGATNIPWDLDPAARRRFQKKIFIGLPDHDARKTILKINLGDTESSLTEDDMDILAGKTESFSGSDLYNLTQDAIYEPLRRCQTSKYFKKSGQYYVPCSPSDQGAFKMSIHEIPEPEYLKPPDVGLEDYLQALNKIKPTVNEEDLIKQDEFTMKFGQEG